MSAERTTEPLRFDQVEFEMNEHGGPPNCSRCNKAISEAYYEVGGNMICSACKDRIAATDGGSGMFRLGKAIALGLPAAALGAGIYYGIAALTGYELGLVAIVIGLLVGGAVRIGAEGRGGWLYQTIAVVLTYVAITSTYIPYIIGGPDEEMPVEQASDTGMIGDDGQMDGDPDQYDDTVISEGGGQLEGYEDGNTEYPLMLSLGVIFLIALVAPFLAGFDNIIGIIIIAIGLYEAWKINKRADIRVNGPFSLSVAPSSSESAADDE